MTPAGTGPVPDPFAASVELVGADEHRIRWRWSDGPRGHGHELTAPDVVDALAGLDADDHLALRTMARWSPRRRPILPPPVKVAWSRPIPQTLDPLTYVAALQWFQGRFPRPVVLGNEAIWGVPRPKRIELAAVVRRNMERTR